jgi:hypothetical protein
MAEEKKKPDLKARLNRTVVGNPPGAAAPPEYPGAGAGTPSAGLDPVAEPVLASSGSDIAVPDFIKQQMAEKAAAEARAAEEARQAAERAARAVAERAAQDRARAMAADPFASSTTSAAPQEIRLVLDDKAVSDDEVGRKNTGAVLGMVIAGAIALAGGFLMGGFMESRKQGARTVEAISDIRRSVDAAGTVIATMKNKVDHAATAAGIAVAGEEPAGQPAAAPQTATIDEDLVTWFAQQPPDPPLMPDVYAGRVGRLRPDLVQKLMKVQFELAQAWGDLRRHQGTTQPGLRLIQTSLSDLQRVRGEYQRLGVVFAAGPESGPRVISTLVSLGAADPAGAVPITPALPGTPPTRTLYTGGDLATPAILPTVAIPVSVSGGLGAVAMGGLTRPWSEYVARVRNLRTLVDTLAQDHRQLADALSRAGTAP